jgi:hypothetical protein
MLHSIPQACQVNNRIQYGCSGALGDPSRRARLPIVCADHTGTRAFGRDHAKLSHALHNELQYISIEKRKVNYLATDAERLALAVWRENQPTKRTNAFVQSQLKTRGLPPNPLHALLARFRFVRFVTHNQKASLINYPCHEVLIHHV